MIQTGIPKEEVPIGKELFIYYVSPFIMRGVQGDCREETRGAYKIHISVKNGPFGQPNEKIAGCEL